MKLFHTLIEILKDTVSEFVKDDVFSLGAALAFFTVLSFSPLVVLLVSAAGFVGPDVQALIVRQIDLLVGERGAEMVQLVIENAHQHQLFGTLSAIAGLVILLFTATTVFVNLQKAMNTIWDVRVTGEGKVHSYLRKRAVGFVMVVVAGAMLLMSFLISSFIEIFMSEIGILLQTTDTVVSLLVYSAMFALLFKYIPDVKVGWRGVIRGAVVTAVMFFIGKYLIGKYLGYRAVATAYGAAGTVVVFLFWIYYSALVAFLGAEVTYIISLRYSERVEPKERAEWTENARIFMRDGKKNDDSST